MGPTKLITTRRAVALGSLCVIAAVCTLAGLFHTFPGDEGALLKFQGFRSTWLDDAAVVSSAFGDTVVVFVSIPTVAVLLWLGGYKVDAVVVLLVFVPHGIGLGLKELVDRPRPEFSLLNRALENPSFPSGHSVHALVFYGLLIPVLRDMMDRSSWKLLVPALLVVLILAIGASRVYLGVHWPSDVLGGFMTGGFGLAGLLWLRENPAFRAAVNSYRVR